MPADAWLLTELRDKTRAEHARIESVLQLAPPLSRERYVGIVGGFHEFLRHWEPRVTSALPAHLRDWGAQRARGTFTAEDLRRLHASSTPHQAETARRAVNGIPIHDVASALGSMYVIEGSALGGQVIAPMLKQHLGLDAETGAAYFHGHGPSTGAMWREFREVIAEELGHEEAAARLACRSAQRTFDALCEIFDVLPA